MQHVAIEPEAARFAAGSGSGRAGRRRCGERGGEWGVGRQVEGWNRIADLRIERAAFHRNPIQRRISFRQPFRAKIEEEIGVLTSLCHRIRPAGESGDLPG